MDARGRIVYQDAPADLSSVAREAAEAEGLRRMPESPMAFHGGIVVDMAKFDRDHFIVGFTECASRLPGERDIEIAILGRTATQAAKAVRALIERGIRGPGVQELAERESSG